MKQNEAFIGEDDDASAKGHYKDAIRMPSHEVLRQRARVLRDKAHDLETLADEIDRRRLSPSADAALFEMVIQAGINCRI